MISFPMGIDAAAALSFFPGYLRKTKRFSSRSKGEGIEGEKSDTGHATHSPGIYAYSTYNMSGVIHAFTSCQSDV
jgi:hypothetical protein